MNGYGNNSLSPQQTALKVIMVIFLAVQAIRQLVRVNGDKNETYGGKVATWMTILLTIIIASLLYPDKLSHGFVMIGLGAMFVGVMGSGIAMLVDTLSAKTKDAAKSAEPNRLWFGIAHLIFALVILAYSTFLLVQ